MMLRTEIQIVLDDLLRGSETSTEVSLDQIGEALGTMNVSFDEIEAIVSALEAAGRAVVGDVGADPKADLRIVIEASHTLRARGETPTVPTLAQNTGLSEQRVRTALRLGQIIGR